MAKTPQHEKTLIKVIVFSTAISFGALGVVMTSMKGFFHGAVSFQFSIWSLLGFILGFIAGWLFWKLVFWKRAKNPNARLED
jgi:multidrug transporter EmrE-like cation transporter